MLYEVITVEGYDEMVVLRDIRFESHCEHHLAPIIGKAHVGYIPTDRVVGISKLARVVTVFAKRLQVQEKLTAQIAKALEEALTPQGVAVILRITSYNVCYTKLLRAGIRCRKSSAWPGVANPSIRRVPRP